MTMKTILFALTLFVGLVACGMSEDPADYSDANRPITTTATTTQTLPLASFIATETFAGDPVPYLTSWYGRDTWVFRDNSGRHSTIRVPLKSIPNGCVIDSVYVDYQRNGSYLQMNFSVVDLAAAQHPMASHFSSYYPVWNEIEEAFQVGKTMTHRDDTYLYIIGYESTHVLYAASVTFSC